MAYAELDKLSYWYPAGDSPALQDATVAFDAGLTVVTGPSGGGKSTLLRVLNGLVPHFHGGRFAGSATVGGHDVGTTPTRELAREVGFVFQDPETQFVYGQVEAEVAFGLENLAVPPAVMRRRIGLVLEQLDIAHLRERRIATLSGGEKQRVALACALALEPRLVVLDEPTSQLDDAGAEALLQSVGALVDAGTAVVIAEHRLGRLLTRPHAGIAVRDGVVTSGERVLPAPRPPSHAVRTTLRTGPAAWALDSASVRAGERELLDHVNLSGRGGEVTVLIGPNGSGKTTLLRVIAGLQAPNGGVAERLAGRIAYLPQDPTALLHRPSVRAEIELTLGREPVAGNAGAVLERFGLTSVATRYPRDLSTGEKQRTALAAVLAGNPALVLLDEPTRGMDEAARRLLIGAVRDLSSRGASIVVATHDRDLAVALGDRVVELRGGGVTELAA